MTAPADPQRLAELRAMIDAIDESVHRLLMQRATVIDELIVVKGVAKAGAAFRPGREADMMRRLAARHEGHLPITAVEHLWREIIATFTSLQAPFSVAVSEGAGTVSAVETARFTFGFSVPLHVLPDAAGVVAWMEDGGTDRLGVVFLKEDGGPWWEALRSAHIVARLPFLDVEGRPAGEPALVIAPPLADPVPFEIGCFALGGPRDAVERVAALPGILPLASHEEAGRRSLLVATANGAALGLEAAGLDMRGVGGYAAPARPGG